MLPRGLSLRRSRSNGRSIPPLDGAFRQNDELESVWPLLELLDRPNDFVIGCGQHGFLSAIGAVMRFDFVSGGRAERFASVRGQAMGVDVSTGGDVAVCVDDVGVFVFDRQGRQIAALTQVDGRRLRSATSLLFLEDATLLVTEASELHTAAEWRSDFLEGRRCGNILQWSFDKGDVRTLARGLAYPYGICLSHGGHSVLLTEAWDFSVAELALDVSGAKPLTRLTRLPGYPARIRRSADGGYWLCFLALRSALVDFIKSESKFCREMMETMPSELWIGPDFASNAYDPHPWKSPHYMSGTQHFAAGQIGGLRRSGAVNPWSPSRSYGLVAKLDSTLDPQFSLHARSNDLYHGITGVCEKDGSLFLVCQGYGALLKCSTTPGIERASEAVEKRKRPRERILTYLNRPGYRDPDPQLLIQVKDATKYYGEAPAIADVNIDLYSGEIHALLGENGAGKSTLCKALSGAIQLTSGVFMLDGKAVNIKSSADALNRGIAMVYQETSLAPEMNVYQNVFLGNEPRVFSQRRLAQQAQEFLSSLNFGGIDVLTPVSSLGQGQRQMVEIARALHHKARVIIFDEPTSTLSPGETARFFELMEMLKRQGVAVVFISHNLEEALDLADRITVMRDGRVVAAGPSDNFSRSSIVNHMVGRDDVGAHYTMIGRKQSREPQRKKILTVENVRCSPLVKNMTFSIYAGEITCIAGLVGSGRSEVARVVAGVLKRDMVLGGNIYLDGCPVSYRQPIDAIADGIVYITEDRKVDGFFETMGASDNIFMGYLASQRNGPVFVAKSTAQEAARSWISRLRVHSIVANQPVNRLSGGNQQKVVLGKALIQKPRVIFVDEPTRGVDVGAITEIHSLLRGLIRDDVAVVVISSYLPEVLKLADRVLVARQGQIVAEFASSEATEAKILTAALS
jgi:ABC-type sugar transport system ATPase subunit